MLNYIFSLTNKTNPFLPNDSDRDFDSYLIPVSIIAIAAFAEIGFYVQQNWNRYVYEQTFDPIEKTGPIDFSDEEDKVLVEETKSKVRSQNSDILPEDFSKVWETFVNETPCVAPKEECEIENHLEKLATYPEAVQKHREAIKQYRQESFHLANIKKQLKNLPKSDASKGVFTLQIKESEQKLKALDLAIQNAYQERIKAFMQDGCKLKTAQDKK